MRTSKVYSISDDEFINLIQNSDSYSNCLRALGLGTRGGSSLDILKRRISELKCPTEHFNGGNTSGAHQQYLLSDILVEKFIIR